METSSPIKSTESDADLLYYIGEWNGSPEDKRLADQAMWEFYRRHHDYVKDVLTSFSKNLVTVELDPDVLCSQTFQKAFLAASRFKAVEGDDADLARRRLRAWLGRIASNLAKSELRALSARLQGAYLVVLPEEIDFVASDSDVTIESPPTPRRLLNALKTSLSKMKPEDRDILITYANFGVLKGKGRELPADVRDALSIRTGYERDNIRQRWARLARKLKEDLSGHITTIKLVPTHA